MNYLSNEIYYSQIWLIQTFSPVFWIFNQCKKNYIELDFFLLLTSIGHLYLKSTEIFIKYSSYLMCT